MSFYQKLVYFCFCFVVASETPRLMIIFNQWLPERTKTKEEENQRTNDEVQEVIYVHRPDTEHYPQQYEGVNINASASASGGSVPSIEIWDNTCDACNRQVCSTSSDNQPISDIETVLLP
jgi:hypothetical protein